MRRCSIHQQSLKVSQGVVLLLAAGWASCSAPPPGTPEAPPSWREPTTGMEFLYISPGTFKMGSPLGEPGREEQEVLHQVTISKGFYLGKYEVTQKQWVTVMGNNPSRHPDCGEECPVEGVTMYDIEEFLARLHRLAAPDRFRLPTEAEWEYACRAGTTTPYSTGENLTTEQANYDGNHPVLGEPKGTYCGAPAIVGSYPPNPWGLHDMHGNVWEWCSDWFAPYPTTAVTDPRGPDDGLVRVIRGGSWFFNAESARSALRYTHFPQDSGFSLGFRIVREAVSSESGD